MLTALIVSLEPCGANPVAHGATCPMLVIRITLRVASRKDNNASKIRQTCLKSALTSSFARPSVVSRGTPTCSHRMS